MNRLPVFQQFDKVTAFFSQKPEKTAELIPAIGKSLPEGEFFIKPWMVHGKRVAVIDEAFLNGPHVPVQGYPSLAKAAGYIELPDTDGLVTDIPGVALATTHGDCIPVFACDPVKKVIGVAHAGWKGTMLGIAGELARVMKDKYGCRPEDINAFIGPGIDRCCFEVRDDVCSQFRAAADRMEEFIAVKDSEHYLIDLKGINRSWLLAQGVTEIEISPDCTCCDEEHYWSYRRSGDTDRMLAYIKLER